MIERLGCTTKTVRKNCYGRSVVEWMTLDEAIKVMKKELKETKEYENRFSLKRNITVLEFVKNNIQKI